MKNRYVTVAIGTIFFAISANAMNSSQPSVYGMESLVSDIGRIIQLPFSLEEIVQFKQISKTCNMLFDVERFCPLSHKLECSTYACACLMKNYYTCGKALSHFARKAKKNAQNEKERKKDEDMFKHLWVHHAVVRDEDVAKILKASTITINDQMEVYRKNYNKRKKLRKHILESIARAICVDNNVEIVKTVLLGNSFDIFDLLSTKSAESCKFYYDIEYLFFRACQLNDAEVISLLCGGTVNDRSLEYVMKNANALFLINLIRNGILPINVADGNNKSVLHYLAEHGHTAAIKMVLDNEAYVNGKDAQGMTPVHYAVKNRRCAATQKILSYEDADVRFADKKGRKPIDYIPVLHWNPTLKPEELREFKAIKKALKNHATQHKVKPHSHAKVHKNGYQRLQ